MSSTLPTTHPLGPGIFLTATFSWATVGRVVRAEARALRHRPYVLAAQAIGAGHLRNMGRHVLPVVIGIASVFVPSKRMVREVEKLFQVSATFLF